MIRMDYKMKFEPVRYRESSMEFFGKRGMSWNGSVVLFRSAEDGGPSDGDGKHKEDHLRRLFLDHIC